MVKFIARLRGCAITIFD